MNKYLVHYKYGDGHTKPTTTSTIVKTDNQEEIYSIINKMVNPQGWRQYGVKVTDVVEINYTMNK